MERKRRYYYENIHGVDQFNMRILRTLSIKLERDYVPFLAGMRNEYKQGPVFEEILQLQKIVDRTLNLLDITLEGSSVNKEHGNEIVENIDRLEKGKDFLVQQKMKNASFRNKLQRVEKETGISVEDMKATSEIARSGVQQAQEQEKEGWGDFLKNTSPGLHELATGGLKDVGKALLGPFAAFGDLASGGLNIAKGLYQRRKIAQGRRDAQSLAASSRGRTMPGDGIAPKQVLPASAAMQGTLEPGAIARQKEMTSDSLYQFFNKDAYKANWTAELLAAVKFGKGGGTESGFLGKGGRTESGSIVKDGLAAGGHVAAGLALRKYTSRISAASLKLGKATGIAIGAIGKIVAFGWALGHIKHAAEGFVEMGSFRKRGRKSADTLEFTNQRTLEAITKDYKEGKADASDVKKMAAQIVASERTAAMGKYQSRSEWDRIKSFWSGGKFGTQPPQFENYYERTRQVEQQITSGNVNASGFQQLERALEDSNRTLLDIKEGILKAAKSSPEIGGGRPRDINDSSDSLLTGFNQGMSVED